MILLTCAKMPDGLDKNTLASAVGYLFSNPKNNNYIEEIRNRANDASANESLFSLALLYEQIKELPYRIDTSKLIFARNECGKPFFSDSDVKFNISHSKGYVACAVSLGEELGVDIEATQFPVEKVEKLAKRYFSESEQKDILSCPKIFSRKWTEKEAKAKFFGESVGNILYQDKNTSEFDDISKIILHKFSIGEIPITLCTKGVFSTIVFNIQ
jgi:phosphopantetheinyl transferase